MRNSPTCEGEHNDALTLRGVQIVSRWLGLLKTLECSSQYLEVCEKGDSSIEEVFGPTVIPPKCSSLISKTTTLTIPSLAMVLSNCTMIDCWFCGENVDWPYIPVHLWWPVKVASLGE